MDDPGSRLSALLVLGGVLVGLLCSAVQCWVS